MSHLIIDTNYNVYTDAKGGDPDSTSPTLRKYHKILWSKPLYNGKIIELSELKDGAYLYHKSELGKFFFGSDAITHSYKSHIRKQWITKQIPDEVDELFDTGSTIGAYIIFPNNRVDGNHTINKTPTPNAHIFLKNMKKGSLQITQPFFGLRSLTIFVLQIQKQ